MAQRTVVTLIDDLTGEEAPDGQTVEFGLDGVTYEIDLAEENAIELRDLLDDYVTAGRKVAGRAKRTTKPAGKPGSPTDREQNKAIREWAKRNGYEISERGRIPREVAEAYHQRAGASTSASASTAAA